MPAFCAIKKLQRRDPKRRDLFEPNDFTRSDPLSTLPVTRLSLRAIAAGHVSPQLFTARAIPRHYFAYSHQLRASPTVRQTKEESDLWQIIASSQPTPISSSRPRCGPNGWTTVSRSRPAHGRGPERDARASFSSARISRRWRWRVSLARECRPPNCRNITSAASTPPQERVGSLPSIEGSGSRRRAGRSHLHFDGYAAVRTRRRRIAGGLLSRLQRLGRGILQSRFQTPDSPGHDHSRRPSMRRPPSWSESRRKG